MNREEFLRGLENALSGNVPPSVVRDNLRYYDDYIPVSYTHLTLPTILRV